MTKSNRINPRFLILFGLILLMAILRVVFTFDKDLSPLSNFTPIGAMALFGGAYFTRGKAFAFPLITLLVSDIILNRFIYFGEWKLFYESFIWTYLAFALMVVVGQWLLKKVNVKNFLLSSLIIVFIHWIVTDFGVWMIGTMYPMTLTGYWACLVAAIPFERNFLAGTLIYGGVLFTAFEWMQAKIPSLRLA
ncbi:MAG TPA: DUF6580 family putative transport protein [Cyclobacteriaceae bacterium]